MSKDFSGHSNIKKTAVTGIIWKTIEQYGSFFAQFFLQVFLARILEPADYGIIAIANVFIALSNVFIQNGFAIAIVQRKEVDEYDLSSIFWASELIAFFLYIVLYLSAPYIAAFYEISVLTLLIRAMALILFMSGYISIQNALIRRVMKFKDSCFINTFAVIISGLCGVFAAMYGLGVWSLVIQQITVAFITLILSFRIVKWKPMAYFDIVRVKNLLNFGGKVLATSLIDEFFVNYRNLLIGKVYTSSDLSFYNRGQSFPGLILKSINGSISAVLLPVLSKVQDNKDDIRNILKRATSCSAFVIFPILTILYVSSPNIIKLLLTDKWLPAVEFIRIFCIYYATWPIVTLALQTLYAIGKPDVVLRLELLRKILDLATIFITLHMGITAIAIGSASVSVVAMIIYLIPCGRLTGYLIPEQIKDVFPVIMGCFVVAPIVYLVDLLSMPLIISLFMQVLLGGISFCIYARLIHLETLDYIINTAKVFLKRGDLN